MKAARARVVVVCARVVVSVRDEGVRSEPARRLSRRQPDERRRKRRRARPPPFTNSTSTTTDFYHHHTKQSESFILSVTHNLTVLEMLFQFVAWVLRTGRAYLEREVIRPLENEVSCFFFPLGITTYLLRCVGEG